MTLADLASRGYAIDDPIHSPSKATIHFSERVHTFAIESMYNPLISCVMSCSGSHAALVRDYMCLPFARTSTLDVIANCGVPLGVCGAHAPHALHFSQG